MPQGKIAFSVTRADFSDSLYVDRLMIQSFVFNDGKLVAGNLDGDARRLVRADSIGAIGLVIRPRCKHWL